MRLSSAGTARPENARVFPVPLLRRFLFLHPEPPHARAAEAFPAPYAERSFPPAGRALPFSASVKPPRPDLLREEAALPPVPVAENRRGEPKTQPPCTLQRESSEAEAACRPPRSRPSGAAPGKAPPSAKRGLAPRSRGPSVSAPPHAKSCAAHAPGPIKGSKAQAPHLPFRSKAGRRGSVLSFSPPRAAPPRNEAVSRLRKKTLFAVSCSRCYTIFFSRGASFQESRATYPVARGLQPQTGRHE